MTEDEFRKAYPPTEFHGRVVFLGYLLPGETLDDMCRRLRHCIEQHPTHGFRVESVELSKGEFRHDSAVREIVARLAAIADAYDDNALDDEARKYWGKNQEHENDREPSKIEIYQGRGGKELLTLQDCFDAREALRQGA